MVNNTDRINALLKRQFKRDLEIFKFYTIINPKELFTKENFISFVKPSDFKEKRKLIETINKYTYSLQLDNESKDDYHAITINKDIFGKTLEEIDNIFNNDFVPKEYKDFYNEYENTFKTKLSDDLNKLLKPCEFDESLQCHYCGITENLIKQLINDTKVNSINTRNRFFTKRFFYGRGKSMEIDQIDPNLGYYLDNMVLACYWCNNAKSDEFDYEEFKDHMAPAIRKIWNGS